MSPLRSKTRSAPLVLAACTLVTAPAFAEEEPESTAPHPVSFAQLWLGVSAALDFLALPSAKDVCKLTPAGAPANSAGYYCTSPNGSDFPARSTPRLTDAGQVSSGLHAGNVRVMLALDYAVAPNILVGARVGYVANASTGSAGHTFGPKLHAELRATYVFGSHPLAREGFAPMAFVGAGVSRFDGHATTAVAFDKVVGHQPIDAWLSNGPFFVVLGSGVRYQFSPRMSFTGVARSSSVLGGNGFLMTVGPEVSVQYGF